MRRKGRCCRGQPAAGGASVFAGYFLLCGKNHHGKIVPHLLILRIYDVFYANHEGMVDIGGIFRYGKNQAQPVTYL